MKRMRLLILNWSIKHIKVFDMRHMEHKAMMFNKMGTLPKLFKRILHMLLKVKNLKMFAMEMMMMMMMTQPWIVLSNEEDPSLHLKRTNHIKTKRSLVMIVKTQKIICL
ncbi:hypothetical protein ACH5RR_012753 [Cinchona calisaya]|uniref:Uncharacterized protein n=1 Tax=Cinchona calisaya TaxID=153742 RepID=A0ABD3AB99_9GENT